MLPDRHRGVAWLRFAVLALAGQWLSCGGEDLAECEDNNCEVPGRTVVQWSFNHYPELLFASDTCGDLGVITVRSEIVGIDDPLQTAAQDVACGQGQVSFLGLAPGNYNVSITPLDGTGNPIVTGPIPTTVIAGSPHSDSNVTINVPYEAWTGMYTGTFLFRLSWAAMSCDAAAVVSQTLTLIAGGQVVTALTDGGQRLDGSDPQPCRPLTEPFAQFSPEDPAHQPGLPFGPAMLVVVGTDGGGLVRFQRSFDTFIGAAKNNPTITFDLPPQDAGVDASAM